MADRDDESIGGAARRIDLLYRDEAAALRKRLRARLGSSEEAGDLVQEAFARLLGAGTATAVRDPAAFLNRIVRNLIIDRSRRQSARPPHFELLEGDVEIPPAQGQALELEQMRERYRRIVESLPQRMREVFILHRVEEVGYKEIAERLDISVRTVEWHMAQAIIRIGRGLDEQ